MIKMIVFDMAGTVVDEGNVVYKTLQRALNNGGVNVTLDEVLAEGAGKEKSKAIHDIASKYDPGRDAVAIGAMYEEFVTLLDRAYSDLDVKPVDGAEELFDELRTIGVYRVLNTGYNRNTALQLLNKLGWRKELHFDELITASDVAKARPFPDMIFKAMGLMAIDDAGTVAKVGDSVVDIEEGKNARCGLTIGITTGAHTRGQLEASQPDYIIDSLRELLPVIHKYQIVEGMRG
jgi:phosphonatase-like hydrolase